jgi:GrpB-like predicted nucleotidyltransferase (UPF0157 family)
MAGVRTLEDSRPAIAAAERLVFRDHLRRDGSVAAEYALLKGRLGEQYRTDREAYTDAKGPFIERVLADAGLR